ncbi:SO_0444 family Cu/Zn efflux transporter [Engelhardtia mirabilis]|uniref:Putative permease n=1 Tax=Engelhardtia mirabilis TaxID=2528011 RepID=A0A518BQJ4_9BACT|nr:putative permease [Planctomycetes bacterium Pla133]QDV03556.1 putative permease [Planctomycetes bacterium Pla86]
MDRSTVIAALAIFVAGLLGGGLPLVRSWSPRALHSLVAVSAGAFLGSVLHVLADLVMAGGEGLDHAGHGHAGHAHASHGHAHGAGSFDDVGLWIGFVAGFLLPLLLRYTAPGRRLAAAHRGDPHALAWRVAFVGLAAHATLAGVGLAPLMGEAGSDLPWGLLGALLGHKAVEVFSLATLMRLAKVPTARAIALVALFSLFTPGAFLLAREAWLTSLGSASWAAGIAGGTFLYVGLIDLLPEAFHEADNRLRAAALLLFGAVLGVLLPGGDLSGLAQVPGLAWGVFVEMAPYLLFGFLVAGVISEFLDPKRLERWLAGEGTGSVAWASVLGAPLPLCSCSVVPVAATLRKAGAGRGATSAFLIATPETGVDSIAATYGLLGGPMALVRPVAAVGSALVTGQIVALFARREDRAGLAQAAPGSGPATPVTQVEVGGCCHPEPEPEPEPPAASCCHAEPAESAPSDGHDHGSHSEPRSRLGRILRHGYVDMVDDLAWSLVLGVVASGVLGALIPAEFFADPLLRGPLGYLVMLAIGLPIYVCASASTPVAAMMIAKGLSPGAALVFLLASPATNLGSLLVVRQLLGSRPLLVHLAVLSIVTLLFGAGLDLLFGQLGISIVPQIATAEHLLPHSVHMVAAPILALLLVAAAWRALVPRRSASAVVVGS